MDCYLVIFAFIFVLAYIHSKNKERKNKERKNKMILEGNINSKGPLGLIKFSNKSQQMISDITAKQKELNVLLKMKQTDDVNEKKEELA